MAGEDRNGAPNIFTTPLEASRNWSVSTPSSIETSAKDCRSDQPTSPRASANGGKEYGRTFERVSKKVVIGFGEGEVDGTKLATKLAATSSTSGKMPQYKTRSPRNPRVRARRKRNLSQHAWKGVLSMFDNRHSTLGGGGQPFPAFPDPAFPSLT